VTRKLPGRNGRIGGTQGLDNGLQHRVLPVIVRRFILAFEFDANREVVASLLPAKTGLASMPGSFRERHELDDSAITPNKQVSRDLHPADFPEIRVCVPVEPVGKQRLDLGTTEFTGRKANAVHDDHRRFRIMGPRILIWTVALNGRLQQACGFVYGEEA